MRDTNSIQNTTIPITKRVAKKSLPLWAAFLLAMGGGSGIGATLVQFVNLPGRFDSLEKRVSELETKIDALSELVKGAAPKDK